MRALKYSLAFKVLLVAICLIGIFETGIRCEGNLKNSGVFLGMWLIQIWATVPQFSNGAAQSVLTFAVTNGFFLYGSIFCVFLVNRYVKKGTFIDKGPKSSWVMFAVAGFCVLTFAHYLAMIVIQQHHRSERGLIFSTEPGTLAMNAYDNIIAIAILIQIAQALINSVLKRSLKR
jgi:hypothetical protein